MLREDLGLTGAHTGCEHGVCGTCTVLRDGRSIRSCITFAVQADGAEIRTVEGLAGAPELNPLQDAFWEKQGLQCGFCTPGMLMRCDEILDAEPGPDPRGGSRGRSPSNLCRCTGYQIHHRGGVLGGRERMRDAGAPTSGGGDGHDRVEAPRNPRGPHAEAPTAQVDRQVRSARVEDPKYLRGRGGYIGDLELPGMLARGRAPQPATRTPGSRRSTRRQARRAPGVHAVDHRRARRPSSPTRCRTSAQYPAAHTWRCLAVDKVRYVGEGVAVVVAESRYLAEDALALIDVEYEPLPAGASTRSRRWPTTRRWSTTTSAPTSPTNAPSSSATSRSDFAARRRGGDHRPAALAPLRRPAAGDGRRDRRLRRRAPAASAVHTNSLSFTSYLFMVAGSLKIPANGSTLGRFRRAAASARSCSRPSRR